MISMDKKYRTRDGRPVRILCVDRNSADFPVVALINNSTTVLYTKVGKFSRIDSVIEPSDLVEISPADGLKVDDPVWVRDNEGEEWLPRHFAKYEDECFHTWIDGGTSHSTPHTLTWTWNQLSRTNPYKT